MAEQVKGKVKTSTVNHYKDCTVDTDIELEDGTTVVYSHVAPIPAEHEVSVTGIKKTLAEVKVELHPQLFRLEDGKLTYLVPDVVFEEVMYSDPQVVVLMADEIHDNDSGITYKERY